MMEDYIRLITKLLNDKEELTSSLEKLETEVKETKNKCEVLTKEKEAHVARTKEQID